MVSVIQCRDLKKPVMRLKLCISFAFCILCNFSFGQQLEIALYKTKLSKEEQTHIRESLKFQIDFYNELFGDSITGNIKARFFGRQSDFVGYSKDNVGINNAHSLAGYFNPRTDELVVFKENGSDRFLSVYSHELSHALLSQKIGRAPMWLNEGLAEFFGAIIFTDQGTKGRISPFRVQEAYGVIKSKSTLKKFFYMTRKDWDKSSRNEYDISWAIINFLYFENLEVFISTINSITKETDPIRILDKEYTGGYDQFHRDIKSYYRKILNR